MKLDDLKQEGWEVSRHRYANLLILLKGEARMLYDDVKQVIHSKYQVDRIKEPEVVGDLQPCDIQRVFYGK
jgi:hypothetical protein